MGLCAMDGTLIGLRALFWRLPIGQTSSVVQPFYFFYSRTIIKNMVLSLQTILCSDWNTIYNSISSFFLFKIWIHIVLKGNFFFSFVFFISRQQNIYKKGLWKYCSPLIAKNRFKYGDDITRNKTKQKNY